MKALISFLLMTTSVIFFGLNCSNSKIHSNRVALNSSSHTDSLYRNFCAGCHGDHLQRFKRLKTFAKSDADLQDIIRDGSAAKGMPSFGQVFSDMEIASLGTYIRNYDYSDNRIEQTTSEEKPYSTEVVLDGLGIVWSMVFLPNGDLLIAEKEGKLSRYSFKEDKLTEITGLPPVRNRGQGGLLDMVLHPNYSDNGWLYISYSYIDKQHSRRGNTAVFRAKIKGNALVDKQEIYRGLPSVSTGHHFGSRMVFDDEGYLYFSIGDRGRRDEFPQKLDNSNGKIHRVHDNGRIPADNPFVGNQNMEASIFSYGHRNPQGLAKHPITREIWEHEHGPKGGDEINIIQKGLNYGWPVISYGINYSGTKFTDITEKVGMQQPIHYYVPSIAPCGMTFLTSDKYPGWENSLLIGSLRFRYLERLTFNGDQVIKQEKLLEELDSRVRDVVIGPDGFIYVSLEDPGRILRLRPK